LEKLKADPQLREILLDDAAILLLGLGLNDGHWFGPSIKHSYFNRYHSDVWRQNYGFRLNADDQEVITFRVDNETIERRLPDDYFTRRIEGRPRMDGAVVFRCGEALVVSDRWEGAVSHGVHDGEITAPMPGRVTAVEVSAGDKVAKGQRLLTLEAMKMEHALVAPFDGVVAELNATIDAQVVEGAILARIEPVEPS
jgi:3-methylcrotonyl-CoA carboxylase alpha subunit